MANGNMNGHAEKRILRIGIIGCGEITQVRSSYICFSANILSSRTALQLSTSFRLFPNQLSLCCLSASACTLCSKSRRQRSEDNYRSRRTLYLVRSRRCRRLQHDCLPSHAILALQHNKPFWWKNHWQSVTAILHDRGC